MIFVVVLAVLACALGCAGPIIKQHFYAPSTGVRNTIVVAPFDVAAHFEGSPEPGTPSAHDAADLVARFMAEALQARGVAVVPAADVVRAFEGQGLVVPRGQPGLLAALAGREFGASGVLLGSVHRYRERLGEALGSLRPASIGFELTLYSAPEGARVWSGRFDETQQSISHDPLRAGQYPGVGSLWLTAGELSRWGADHAAAAIAALP